MQTQRKSEHSVNELLIFRLSLISQLELAPHPEGPGLSQDLLRSILYLSINQTIIPGSLKKKTLPFYVLLSFASFWDCYVCLEILNGTKTANLSSATSLNSI